MLVDKCADRLSHRVESRSLVRGYCVRLGRARCACGGTAMRASIPLRRRCRAISALLESGDVISADLRLSKPRTLLPMNQCYRRVGRGRINTAPSFGRGDFLRDWASTLFEETALTRGSGSGVVTATGLSTELGRDRGSLKKPSREARRLKETCAPVHPTGLGCAGADRAYRWGRASQGRGAFPLRSRRESLWP